MAVLRVLHQHFIIFSLFPLYHNKAQMMLAMKLRSTYGVSSKLDRIFKSGDLSRTHKEDSILNCKMPKWHLKFWLQYWLFSS